MKILLEKIGWSEYNKFNNARILMYVMLLTGSFMGVGNHILGYNYGASFITVAITTVITWIAIIYLTEKVYAQKRWARITFNTLFIIGILPTIAVFIFQWDNGQYLTVIHGIIYTVVQVNFLQRAFKETKVVCSNYYKKPTFA